MDNMEFLLIKQGNKHDREMFDSVQPVSALQTWKQGLSVEWKVLKASLSSGESSGQWPSNNVGDSRQGLCCGTIILLQGCKWLI